MMDRSCSGTSSMVELSAALLVRPNGPALSCRPRAERCLSALFLHRFCGLSDHVEHKVGLGQHRNVAAVGLEGVRSHTLCDETLQGGLDGTVTAGDDVPARFRSPSCTVYLLIEQ